jgi:hypothetical protein
MLILHSSSRSVRNSAIAAIFAALLYILPNLVQDLHRILSHHEISFSLRDYTRQSVNHQDEKCPVCIFEFNSADEIKIEFYPAVLSSSNFTYCENDGNQFALKVFNYSQLRAPPVS